MDVEKLFDFDFDGGKVDYIGNIDDFVDKNHESSHETWVPDTIVLGPGGLKGFMELGALERLNREGLLGGIDTYVGVSIGSVISILHLCGLSPIEICDLGLHVNLFLNWNIGDVGSMLEKTGIIDHQIIREILVNAIIKKRGSVPSFSQLYRETKKNLITVSYNLTRKETYYFSRMTHPDVSIVEAALASSSIPGIFYKYIRHNEIYIDGAFGNPYPVDLMDDGVSNILGIYISGSDRIDPNDLTGNINGIIHAPITELRKHIILNSSKRCKHLELQGKTNDLTGLQVCEGERMTMFRIGYGTCDNFLKNR